MCTFVRLKVVPSLLAAGGFWGPIEQETKHVEHESIPQKAFTFSSPHFWSRNNVGGKFFGCPVVYMRFHGNFPIKVTFKELCTHTRKACKQFLCRQIQQPISGWHRQARENGINLLGLKRLVACNRLFWSTHFRNYANNNLALPSGKHLESFPFVQPPTLVLPLGEMWKIFRANFHTGLQRSTQAFQKAFISNERRERDDDESSATFDVIFLLKKWETLYSGCGRCRGIFPLRCRRTAHFPFSCF